MAKRSLSDSAMWQPRVKIRGLQRQRGVALITVLLVMVIAVAAVTHAVTRNRLAISRTSAILANTQLAEFVTGAEAWVIVTLGTDFEKDKKSQSGSDSNDEPWAQRQSEFNPDNGKIRIQIKDLQSCFNVNNLTAGGDGLQAQADVLKRLVRNADGKPELALAIQDWLDKDDIPQASDTEDSGYLGLEQAYRTPDTWVTDQSELQAVQGMNAEVWAQLQPQLCALPQNDTQVNINTASEALLRALYPTADITRLISDREKEENGFNKGSDLTRYKLGSNTLPPSFSSQYFVAYIAVQLGSEHQQYWESIFKREENNGQVQVRVLQRQRREFSGQFLQDLLGD